MRKIFLILSLCLGVFALFLPNYVAADYSQDLDTCTKILSKSSSPNEYCNLHIDAIFGDRVTGPMVAISNAYVYPESGVKQATKFLEEEYKSKLNWMKNPSDQRPGLEKYMKVIEEARPDNMKFLIRQSPDLGFYTAGPNIVYTYHSYLFMQQGSCVMVIDGTANIGYVKSQNNKIDDVSGDVKSLKKESITYMNKVGDDLTKNCKKEIIKTETPAAPALIDKPPKQSDFRKISLSDFRKVYPVSSDSASLKVSTSSSGIAFIGKISREGELLVEFPNGKTVTLADDYTGVDVEEARIIWQHNVKLLNPRFVRNIIEKDCHIQIAQSIKYQEEFNSLGFVRKVPNYDFDSIRKTVGDCSDLDINGLMRIFVQKGPATLNIQNGSVLADQNADFGFFNDVNRGVSTIEIYNGSVTVKNKSGQAKTISSVYGSEIKQIEVAKDGTMNEQIAIPQSGWEAFLASQKEKDKETSAGSSSPIISAVAVLGIGGLIFFLYRTGRLIPLYKTLSQKVSGLIKRFNKTGREEGN